MPMGIHHLSDETFSKIIRCSRLYNRILTLGLITGVPDCLLVSRGCCDVGHPGLHTWRERFCFQVADFFTENGVVLMLDGSLC
jgi:hypothetical protein